MAVQFAIGPVASDVARAWLDNSRSLVAAVRAHRGALSIWAHDDTLELCDVLLGLWTSRAETGDVFEWSMSTEPDVVLQMTQQWLEIGSLSDDELAAIGASWAPDWTRPFADALVVGATSALEQCGDAADELLQRLRSG
jgi:hypothetical protein